MTSRYQPRSAHPARRLTDEGPLEWICFTRKDEGGWAPYPCDRCRLWVTEGWLNLRSDIWLCKDCRKKESE